MVFQAIAELIAERNECDISEITPETTLEDLGIDSLFMILLSLAAEQKFNMRFPDGQAAPTTVGGVCDAVLKALEA